MTGKPVPVLIITYYWPPSGGPGVQRWVKFTKYLPQFGIEPFVLTVAPEKASYAQLDHSLEKEVTPSLKVIRTNTFELYNFYRKLTGSAEIPYGGFVNEQQPGLFQKLIRFARSHLFIPDPRKGWNRFAYRKAVQLIREHNIKIVITTSPPHSTQLIGRRLKRKLGITWISDLRDPWTDIFYYDKLYHSNFSKWADKRMEQSVLLEADSIVTVSIALKRILATKTKDTMEGKISVIPNGFDEEDFSGVDHAPTGSFTITYTGTMSDEYPVDAFLAAIQQMNVVLKNKLKLRFVGSLSPTILTRIKESGIERQVELIDYVEHATALEYLLSSQALLLVIPRVKENEGILTGKLFEYMGSRKPIIAIGPVQGDAAKILDECAAGKMFDYSDIRGLASFLDELGNSWNTDEGQNSGNAMIEEYSRKNLTGKLAQLIKRFN